MLGTNNIEALHLLKKYSNKKKPHCLRLFFITISDFTPFHVYRYPNHSSLMS